MTTAQNMIDSSAKMAGILAEGQSLESGVNTDALNRLNRMFARWANIGIDLGLATLAASDTVYVDVADEEAIELSLALRLMVKHRRQIAPGLSEAGDQMVTELQSKYSNLPVMALDAALSGSQRYNINNG
ncbi:MAG: hypothetical protein JKY22_12095 [Flavobacteriaceae bacterium]|nr:hypothetical protein [Flavobacteriaceae bacterium]PCJ26490.1 MAG: hypothetical protein COA94_05115 [Rickettsiales bacterium]